MNSYTQTFLIKFNETISFNEIPAFRGAIIKLIDNPSLLFHNHIDDDSVRYSYPLIQYKRINGKAAIFCISEGITAIGNLLSMPNYNIDISSRSINLSINKIVPQRHLIQIWDSCFNYRIRNWLPLNSKNYQQFCQIEELSSQIAFLEKILIGNILSFAKGIGVEINKDIVCKLIAINGKKLLTAKSIKMMAFDIEFKINVSLPDFIGLGKHSSIGFGTTVRNYEKNKI